MTTIFWTFLATCAILALFAGLANEDGYVSATVLRVGLTDPRSPLRRVLAPLAVTVGVTAFIFHGSLRLLTFVFGAAAIASGGLAYRMTLLAAGADATPQITAGTTPRQEA